MERETTARRIEIGGPQLRADRRGYLLNGEHVEGFGHRPDLDTRARRLIAEWARAFTPKEISPEQSELLDQPLPGLTRTEAQLRDAAIDNAEHAMPLAVDVGLYERLNAEEVRLIREPWLRLGGESRRDYPLSVGELAQLAEATPKQIRYWADNDLLPAYWIDGRRHFFSAAAVHALALGRLDRTEVRALTRVLTREAEDPIRALIAAAESRSLQAGRQDVPGLPIHSRIARPSPSEYPPARRASSRDASSISASVPSRPAGYLLREALGERGTRGQPPMLERDLRIDLIRSAGTGSQVAFEVLIRSSGGALWDVEHQETLTKLMPLDRSAATVR